MDADLSRENQTYPETFKPSQADNLEDCNTIQAINFDKAFRFSPLPLTFEFRNLVICFNQICILISYIS